MILLGVYLATILACYGIYQLCGRINKSDRVFTFANFKLYFSDVQSIHDNESATELDVFTSDEEQMLGELLENGISDEDSSESESSFSESDEESYDDDQSFHFLGALPISSDKNCRRISEELLDGGNSDDDIGSVLKPRLPITLNDSVSSESNMQDDVCPRITREKLEKWQIVERIDKVCQNIGRNLREQCLKDLEEQYLKNPKYLKDPDHVFQKALRLREQQNDYDPRSDLPLLALHKLHETPEFLDQIHQDRGKIHHQLMDELLKNFSQR